jgi:type I restriction enzyme, S subunit
MSNDPDAWAARRLGDVLDVQNGFAFDASLFHESDGVPLIRIRDLKAGVATETRYRGEFGREYLVHAGDFLIGMDGSFRCYRWDGPEALLNQRVCRLQGFHDDIEPDFVFYGVNEHLRRIENETHYSTVKHISSKQIKDITLQFPSRIEQQRIVVRIKEGLERLGEIAELRTASTSEAAAVFPAVLRALFAELSVAHKAQPLEMLANIIGGQSLPRGTIDDPGDNIGVLLFKVGDMNLAGNELYVGKAREYALHGSGGRVVAPGAVVFPKRGGAIATNKKRLLARHAMLDPNLMAVVPKLEFIRPSYLLAWLENIDLRALSNGGVIPQINKKDLSSLSLPVPSLSEQDEILVTVEQARAASTELYQTVAGCTVEMEVVREAVLRRAFGGHL